MAEHDSETESHAALIVHLSYLKDGVDECRDLLKVQNGRISKTETAVIVLETKANEAKTSGRNWGAASGTAGGFLGGFVSGLLQRLLGGSLS